MSRVRFPIDLDRRRPFEQRTPPFEELSHGGVRPDAFIVLAVGGLIDVLHEFDETLAVRVIGEKSHSNSTRTFIKGNCIFEKPEEFGLAMLADTNPKMNADGRPPAIAWG